MFIIEIFMVYVFFFRNDAEIAYAKALRKNSDALQKLAGRAKG
jgi:hypothetical protein